MYFNEIEKYGCMVQVRLNKNASFFIFFIFIFEFRPNPGFIIIIAKHSIVMRLHVFRTVARDRNINALQSAVLQTYISIVFFSENRVENFASNVV